MYAVTKISYLDPFLSPFSSCNILTICMSNICFIKMVIFCKYFPQKFYTCFVLRCWITGTTYFHVLNLRSLKIPMTQVYMKRQTILIILFNLQLTILFWCINVTVAPRPQAERPCLLGLSLNVYALCSQTFCIYKRVHCTNTCISAYVTVFSLTMCRTAPVNSKRCILYIYSTNVGTEYFKHALYSPFFLFKMQFVS